MKSLGRLISILYRKGVAHMNHALGDHGLTAAELPFLTSLLRSDGVTQEHLSSYLQIDKAATTRAIQSLERKGLIAKHRSVGDRRCNQVFLTEQGRQSGQYVLPILAGWSDLLVEGMDDDVRDCIYAALEAMVANVERREVAHHG